MDKNASVLQSSGARCSLKPVAEPRHASLIHLVFLPLSQNCQVAQGSGNIGKIGTTSEATKLSQDHLAVHRSLRCFPSLLYFWQWGGVFPETGFFNLISN